MNIIKKKKNLTTYAKIYNLKFIDKATGQFLIFCLLY